MSSAALTHSRLACFRACPRRHLYRYEYGLRPDIESEALRLGQAFALAVEADANGLVAEDSLAGRVEDPYELARVAAMFNGHRQRWAQEPLEYVATELAFDIPLVNPETGAPTPLWTLAGKIDAIVRLADGRMALLEYKTTSRDFAPGADYWLRLQLDMQLSIYLIAARELGYDLQTIVYDVTRRPGLKPLKATPEESRKYVSKTGALYANQRADDETPEEYAARLAVAIEAEPAKHFARIEIARTDSDLDEARAEIWNQQKSLREMQRSGRWYRNPEACVSATGQKCDFLSVCQYTDLATRTPQGFRRVEDPNEELATPGQAGDYARAGQAAQKEVSNVR